MNFDFPAIMVTATFITGAIWALDALLWAPKRRLAASNPAQAAPSPGMPLDEAHDAVFKEPVVVEYARSLFPVILAVLLLRSFVVEPFRIPSGSMMPTLLTGDFILVNKFAYGLRLPVLDTKVIPVGEPQRGDVVVFRYPKDPSVDYIKRVVGLPGDRIGYFNKQIYVNGVPVRQDGWQTYIGEGASSAMTGAKIRTEYLGKAVHKILIEPTRPGIEGEYVVPEGHYFMMGDNRDNSNDGRYWGFVPEENLVGKAFFIWMSWDGEAGGLMWKRIGDGIE